MNKALFRSPMIKTGLNRVIKTRLNYALLIIFALVTLATNAYDVPESLKERFRGRHLTPAEGLWLWSSGAIVAVEADANGALTLTMVETLDPLASVPFVIGTGKFSGKEGTYDIELVVKADLSKPGPIKKKAKFIAKITNGKRLSLAPYSTGLKINLWRLVPYLFRFSVSTQNEPADLHGAIKIWPSTGTPEFPVIL